MKKEIVVIFFEPEMLGRTVGPSGGGDGRSVQSRYRDEVVPAMPSLLSPFTLPTPDYERR
jgi:hypothetical protein